MFPFRIPLILILLFPIAEIYAFVEIGRLLGGWQTVLWVIFSAIVGFMLLRFHGLSAMQRIQASMLRGELPARTMFDSLLLFFSAILFIIPGFISDALGLLLMLPPVRWVLVRLMMRRAVILPQGNASKAHRSDILEGEYKREDGGGQGPLLR